MKLRIRDNSIRLRLSQSEVDAVENDGIVSASVPFAGGTSLTYCVESTPACVDPVANLTNNELSVRLPKSWVDRWASSDEVSLQSEQQLEHGEKLKILVEKDFACLAPREGEDETDMFPHPLEGQANC